MHIFVLRIVHTLIVYLWQCVQLHTKFFELLTFLLIFELWQSVKINILRMESKDTYTRVRIRIGPGMCDSGVVDREDLEHSLTRCCHPVNHLHQVTEIAYSEAVLTTQREDGDDYDDEDAENVRMKATQTPMFLNTFLEIQQKAEKHKEKAATVFLQLFNKEIINDIK